MKALFFISKDANWQRYRNDIFKKLSQEFNATVTILTTGMVREYLENDVGVAYYTYRSWFSLKWKPSFFPGALLKIIRERPDVVLCMANISQLTELFALPLCKLLGIRFVWWTHGYDHKILHGRFLQAVKEGFVAFLFRYADAIITFSDAGRDFVIARSVPASRVFCAPNTLNTDRWLELAQEVRESSSRVENLRELGLDANARVALLSGRLLSDKRIDDAIYAVEKVRIRFPNVYLVIIGDGPHREHLRCLAETVLPGACVFLGDVFEEHRLARIFSIAEAFLLPGFVGLAIIHAFCFGIPLITERTENQGPEIQYLHDKYNGYLVDGGDVNGLAECLITLLDDSENWQRMSSNALETVQNEANVHLMLSRMALALNLLKAP